MKDTAAQQSTVDDPHAATAKTPSPRKEGEDEEAFADLGDDFGPLF